MASLAVTSLFYPCLIAKRKRNPQDDLKIA
jgi:hypothetical protein